MLRIIGPYKREITSGLMMPAIRREHITFSVGNASMTGLMKIRRKKGILKAIMTLPMIGKHRMVRKAGRILKETASVILELTRKSSFTTRKTFL
jgi:hypothetical protein